MPYSQVMRRGYLIAASLILILGIAVSLTAFIRQWLEGFLGPDYVVFWQAGRFALERPTHLYDFEAITAAQQWITRPAGLRPFANPPSALLLFVPMSLLPFVASYTLWVTTSILAYVHAARRIVSGRRLWLLMASPPVAFSLLSGQVALLTAAVVMVGLDRLHERPVLSGALLGVAAAVKPQALLLFPIACVSGHHWRALASFAASGVAMIAASMLLFGWELWLAWISALVPFLGVARDIEAENLSPVAFADVLGLQGNAVSAVRLVGIMAGVSLCWWAFKRRDLEARIVGLAAGSILCAPYAMNYQLAALAPVALAMLLSGRPWGLVGGLPILGSAGFITVPLLALATVVGRRTHQPTIAKT